MSTKYDIFMIINRNNDPCDTLYTHGFKDINHAFRSLALYTQEDLAGEGEHPNCRYQVREHQESR